MPLVLNGTKLLIKDSDLAASTSCCCKGDTPCFCPDFCQYTIRATAPAEASTAPLPISAGDICATFFRNSDIEFVPASISCDLPQGFSLLDRDGSIAALNDVSTVQITVARSWYYFSEQAVANNNFIVVSLQQMVGMGCSFTEVDELGRPSLVADVRYDIIISRGSRDVWDRGFGIPLRRAIGRYSQYKLDTSCDAPLQDRSCEGLSEDLGNAIGNNLVLTLSDPVTVSVGLSSTSLGAWQQETDQQAFDQSEIGNLPECLGDLPDAVFEIGERPCRTYECDCSSSPAGMHATFEGKQFVVGTPQVFTESGNPSLTWEHETTGGDYVFKWDEVLVDENQNTSEAKSIRLELYCETDNSESPAVDRWYAMVTRACLYVEAGQIITTTTQTLGQIECGELSGCGSSPEGSIVPIGPVVGAETLPGFPITERDLQPCGDCVPCEVPGEPEFILSENCN